MSIKQRGPLHMHGYAKGTLEQDGLQPPNPGLPCTRVFTITPREHKQTTYSLSESRTISSFFLFEGERKDRMSNINPPKQQCGPPNISKPTKSIGATPSLIAAATMGNTHAANIMATRNPKIASGFLPVVGSVATLLTDTHSI